MKLSAMTLGCPAWDLATILKNVKSYGYDGVDFRGVLADLDITKTPAFTTGLAATARQIKDAGLEVSGISSSLTVCDPAKHDTQSGGGQADDSGGPGAGGEERAGVRRRAAR